MKSEFDTVKLSYRIDDIFWNVTFFVISAETLLRIFNMLPSRHTYYVIEDMILFIMFMIVFLRKKWDLEFHI